MPKATDSTKMSSASTSHVPGERLRLVHPRVGGEARRDGVGEQPGEPHRLHDARRQLAAQPRRARLALDARARSPSCPRTPSCRAASISRASASACASTSSSDAAASARADDAIPPPARAISSYGTPVTLRSYSSARQPANGRCVWQSTKPGSTAQPRRVDAGRRPGASSVDVAGLERQLARAVVAQVRSPLGHAQHLRRAADRERHPHRDPHAEPVGRLDRLVVARVDVAHDAHPGVGEQRAPDPLRGELGPVGDADLAGVQREAHADAAAVVERDPRGARRRVDERVEDRPVGDRVASRRASPPSRAGARRPSPASRWSRPITIGALTSPEATSSLKRSPARWRSP